MTILLFALAAAGCYACGYLAGSTRGRADFRRHVAQRDAILARIGRCNVA